MMTGPNGGGFFVRGSANINAMLEKGWSIVPSDRNHLLPERMNGAQQESNGQNGVNIGLDPVKMETEKVVEVQEKRRGRPRKHQQRQG